MHCFCLILCVNLFLCTHCYDSSGWLGDDVDVVMETSGSGSKSDFDALETENETDHWSPHTENELDYWSPHTENELDYWSPHTENELDYWSPHTENEIDHWSPHTENETDHWSPHTETAEQLQGKLCPRRCNGTEMVNYISWNTCFKCFPCDCDENCVIYGTCCPPVNQSWQPPPTERAECRKSGSNWNLHVMTCYPIYPYSETRILCESKAVPKKRDTGLPVTSLSTGITYANRYCHECNIDISGHVQWTMSCLHNQYLYNVTSDTQYNNQAILLPDICHAAPQYVHPRLPGYCDKTRQFYVTTDVISKCNVTGQWKEEKEHVRKACEESDWSRGAMVIVNKTRKYANVFCVMCNEGYVLEKSCKSNYERWEPPTYSQLTELVSIYPPVELGFSMKKDCEDNYWSHPKKGCQKVECTAGKLPAEGRRCQTPVKRVSTLGYRLHVLLQPVSLMTSSMLSSHKNLPSGQYTLPLPMSPRQSNSGSDDCHYGGLIKQALNQKLSIIFDKRGTIMTSQNLNQPCFYPAYQSRLEALMADGSVTPDSVNSQEALRVLNINESNRNAASFLAAVVDFDIINDKYNRDHFELTAISRIFDQELTIDIGVWTVKLKAFDLTSVFGRSQVGENGGYEGSDGHKASFPYEKQRGWKHPLNGLEHLFLPLTRHLLCQHVSFAEEEFEVKMSNGELTISFPHYLDSDMQPVSFKARDHPNKVWLKLDQELIMCVDTFDEVFPQNVTVVRSRREVSEVRRILSVVCGSLSVVCLILTFLTYSLFRELRSLPGLNNMGLCFTLAAAELSMLIPWLRNTDYKAMCTAVGVGTHWLWLMALMWMGVCCLHMLRVFIANTRQAFNQREVRKVFLHNVLFTVLISTGIVMLTMVVSAAVSGASSIGYGGFICFLDTSWNQMLILAFLVPLGLVVLVNLICFIVTIVSIIRVRRLTSQGGTGVRDVLVYAKLATVTGAGWALILLSQISHTEWMLVLAELCTTLQGVLLFLAYVCNVRVWRLYRARLAACGLPCGLTKATATPSTVDTVITDTKTANTV